MVDKRMKTTPYAHQAEEFEASKDKKFRALLWQMRTGKTKLVIDQASYLFCENKLDGLIVFAPNGVHSNWVLRELPVHGWDCVEYAPFYYSHPKRDVRQQEFKNAMDSILGMRMGILTINIEALQYPECKAHIVRWMKRYPRFMVVFDESHKFGAPGAKRTQRARGLAKRAAYRRILSGSVIDNSPLKAFSQFELLKPGCLGFPDYDHFKSFFAVYKNGYMNGRTYPKLDKYINLGILRERIAKYSSLVRRCDCEDLPELITSPVYLEMTSKQADAYRQAIDELCVDIECQQDIDDLCIEILEGGPLNMKLRTIASGFIKDTETGEIYELVKPEDNPKINALLDMIEDMGDDKLLVWCNFRYDIETLMKVFKKHKIKAVKYYGGVKEDEKNAAIDSFRDDPTVRVFVGQPVSAGEGLNLSAASGMVWYSHTYDAEVRNQANERATVVGGDSVWLSDFVFDGLVETRIIENLIEKGVVREEVVGEALRQLLDQAND